MKLRDSVTIRRATALSAGAAVVVPAGMVALAPSATAAPVTAPTLPSAPLTPQAAPGVPKAPTSPATVTVLRYGAKGDLVRTLQSRLRTSVDGNFGPLTLKAVKSFQSGRGLAADGVVGPLTWKALGGFPGTSTGGGTTTPTPTPTPTTCSSYVLRYGSFGDMVKVAQQRLGLTADGDFGPGMLTAVKKYQGARGMQVDGIVGPLTWKSLGGYPCDTANPTPAPSGPGAPPPGPVAGQRYTGQDVLDIAKKYLGIWYVYGGSTPSGFDCSGLTQYVHRQVGVNLPRTSRQQSEFREGVDLNDLRVGDLVFFYAPVRHVAIYAGNGMILDASKPGTQISIHKMWVNPVKAIRLL